MSQIKAKIQAELKAALKKREAIAIATLRLLLSDIHNLEIQKKREASDDDVLAVLGKSMKTRQDSVAQFRQGGREDLASREEAELEIVQSYLPSAVGEEELRELVSETVAELKRSGQSLNLGLAMKAVMPKVKGRAPGQQISETVKRELEKS